MRISDWSSDVCSSDLREKPAIIEWLAIGVVSEVFTGHGETAKGYPSVILDSIQTQITPCFQPLDQLQEPPADLLRGERRVVGWRGGYGHGGGLLGRCRRGGRVESVGQQSETPSLMGVVYARC